MFFLFFIKKLSLNYKNSIYEKGVLIFGGIVEGDASSCKDDAITVKNCELVL